MKNKLYTLLLSALLTLGVQAQQTIETKIKSALLLQGFTPTDVEQIIITNQYTSKHNGVTHVYFRQKYQGIEVFNGVGSIHLKNNQTVTFNQSFVKDIAVKAQALKVNVTPNTAMYATANHLALQAPAVLAKTTFPLVDNKLTLNDDAVSTEPINVQLYYYLTEAGTLKLAYNTNWLDAKTNNWWNVRVDAANGEVIDKNNWSVSCNNQSHHHATTLVTTQSNIKQTTPNTLKKRSDGATYNALPLGVESPNHGSRKLLINPSDSFASPYGWHDTNAVAGAEYTITAGNNVYASEDKDNNNIAGYSPDGGPNLAFDYPYDMLGSNKGNLNAAITNLFVWNNFMHDVMYHYGFDEESGNFQFNNYGRGGKGNDAVNADAQDGSGTGNANFATPADGQKPRMQMYLWPRTGVTLPAPYVKMIDNSRTDSTLAVLAAFGGKTFDLIRKELVLVNDGSTNTLGCTAFVGDYTGKVVLIDRGTCNFPTKVRNAQNAGAVMVIVVNLGTSAPYQMTGTPSSDITIPAIMISKVAGDSLKARLLRDSVFVSLNPDIDFSGVYDSDFDNAVIAHEYGHGISNRLTGGPANSNCLTNQEQVGEGWSDFFGLVLTHGAMDSVERARGVGTWLSYQAINGIGIRTYRYSRNMTTNPSTYNYIKSASIPHGVGAVWCSMLYDLYWNLIDKYGYDSNLYSGTGGNNRALQLVIDGLKLQPCNPGFVDARDAILAADKMNNNGADSAIIWSTFARRGLGYSADQGLTSSRGDGTAAFDLPPNTSTGLNELNKESGMSFWPNPNQGEFEILMPKGATTIDVELYDITGKQVYNQTLTGTETVIINAKGLPIGVYILKTQSNGKVFTGKLLITE
ncbi:MAG: T9SS-dependent M36 family metallopeptidase [Bacteroidia bacterium]